MTNEERPNQVQACADCTVAGTLKELVDVFEHDIKCFNGLPEEKRGSHAYTLIWRRGIPSTDGWACSANGISMHDDVVFRKMVADAVRVSRNNHCMFEIPLLWNTETLECDLKVEGPRRILWQISRQAVGGLLFD